jgi:hypothetical protein
MLHVVIGIIGIMSIPNNKNKMVSPSVVLSIQNFSKGWYKLPTTTTGK